MTRHTARMKRLKRRKTEGGFTLFLALFGVLFLSGYILLNINIDSDRTERQRANETAWLVSQLADAARLYVRDQAVNTGSPFERANLCAAPRAITPLELTAGGYIRDTIGQLDATGLAYITPLGQTVRLVAAISDLGAGCGNLNGVASSAYIILEPGPRTNRQNILYLSEALNNRGITINPPLFDAAGNNISPNCGGGPATIQWNTGCVTAGQYSLIHPAGPFVFNTLGMPAWLAVRGDNRAVFRYPQPENPQAQTMATDLDMAPITAANLNIRTVDEDDVDTDPLATELVASGVLRADEDAAGTDNRRNLTNVGTLSVNRIIVDPQAVDFSDSGAVETFADRDLTVSGTTTVGSAAAPANARSFPRVGGLSAGTLELSGASGLAVLCERDPATGLCTAAPLLDVFQIPGNPATGVAELGVVQGTTGTTPTTSSVGPVTATIGLDVVSSAAVQGAQGVIAKRLAGSATQLTVGNDAVVSGQTRAGSASVIGTNGPLSFATARLDAQSGEIQGDLTVAGDVSTNGGATISSITSVGTCLGDCPDRTDIDPPL